MIMPEAICAVIWLSTILLIALGGFRYPVSIDEEYVIDSLDAREIVESVRGKNAKTKPNEK